MDGAESAIGGIMSHSQDEVCPVREGDYVNDDGLVVCGKCGKRKQREVEIFGIRKVVPVVCDCRKRELEEEAMEQERKGRLMELAEMRGMSLMSERLKEATFDRYVPRPENEEAHRTALKYAERFGEMYEQGQGLLIYGPVGTGKSFTAACIANRLLDEGVPVVMTSFVRILQDIQPGGADEGHYLAMLDRARLLIIDDLGAERDTEYAMEKVYNVIDARTRSAKPMILTTNMTLQQMKSPDDIRYARIYDRIFEACYPMQMSGRSMRLDEGNKRYAKMRAMLAGKE